MVDWLRARVPKPNDKIDLTRNFAIILRACRMFYGTTGPAFEVIAAYLDPNYRDQQIRVPTPRGQALVEFLKAVELTRASGGLIGCDPDDRKKEVELEPDDVLMGLS
jgi:hypothetical protein